MRVPIRVQLGSLLLISSLIGLAVISIAVWVTVHDFVLSLRAGRLSLVASLKASQLSSNIDVMQTSASFVSSRVIIQNALTRYNANGDTSNGYWTGAGPDLAAAVGTSTSQGQELFLQAIVYGANDLGPDGRLGCFSSTAGYSTDIVLPYSYPNGTKVKFGDNVDNDGAGYPPSLYPNLTYSNAGQGASSVSHNGIGLRSDSLLILGPWTVNDTFSMLSLTLPIVNNNSSQDVLGWITAVMDNRLIRAVMDSPDGLGSSGETILLGPADSSNVFPSNITTVVANNKTPEFEVRFLLPLRQTQYSDRRHPDHIVGTANEPFNARKFPTIYDALAKANETASNDMGANLRAKNEAGKPVSVGYAMAPTTAVDWIVLLEQDRSEVWQPINKLRVVLVVCLFATAVFMALVSYPLAHFASLPILRLRQATARSIEPASSASRSSFESFDGHDGQRDGTDDAEEHGAAVARKEGFRNPVTTVTKWKKKRERNAQIRREERAKHVFRIPAKVKEQKHCIKDELSDLTRTFNEMSDELMMQYSKLEERVQQRTAELELSKKAAEAANESKTLFIANISHELKTPLNGILGMCAVCMQEDDPIRLKRSLGIIYKSGDLLLNLLTDLLSFSKNQVGNSMSLEEKEFRLRDISTQITAIFEKQASEGNIDLRVEFQGVQHLTDGITDGTSPDTHNGPSGTGRMRDMILWGDVHRILQIVINLVSNSLKFTPKGGSVVLTIRCLPDIPEPASRNPSMTSKTSRQLSSRHRGSDGTLSVAKMSTANAINVKDKPHALAYVSASERNPSPPPGRYLYFEFEVVDTGPGVPEPLQDKIFEPFVQGELGLNKKYGGTGLGLSICSQLANLMRGSISLRSKEGAGSTFTVRLPLRMVQSRLDSSASSTVDNFDSVSRSSSIDNRPGTPSHPPPAERMGTTAGTLASPRNVAGGSINNGSQPRLVGLSQPFFASSQPLESPNSQPAAMKQISDEAARAGKIRVLVAEDNKVNQEVVLRMLKLEDIYDVTIAKDGQEALDIVRDSMKGEDSKPFNLIFMDVQMPNVNGLESTRLIREIGYQAPIVALTAFAEESNIKDCLDSGMNYFLSKPIRRPQLKKVLKEYCPPIPEEVEELAQPGGSGSDERRGSAVNTTIIVNAPPASSTPLNTGPPGGPLSQQQATLNVPQSPITGRESDSRPVSPRDTSGGLQRPGE